MVEMAGGKSVKISSYPDFKIDIEKVEAAITDKTKMIILNSPSNPTGICPSAAEIKAVSELAFQRGICLVSDEIYSKFTYDEPHVSAAKYNPDTIVIDGFSKTYAMTGWRVGYVHGPSKLMQTMLKIQQFTFVCAPQPAQWAGAVAMDVDMSGYVASYKSKRDRMLEGLKTITKSRNPVGLFTCSQNCPGGTEKNLLRKPSRII